MKDLFVLTADADAEAVMRRVLRRPHAIGIREISCEVDRHIGRDPGIIHNGPALVRFKKGLFHRVLLLWDHQGSGKEGESSHTVQDSMATQLDHLTWKDNHLAIAVVPELEEWLWHNPESVRKHLDISEQEMNIWVDEFVKKTDRDLGQAGRAGPKERFGHLVHKKRQHGPRPDDFEKIASIASLIQWQQSASFGAIVKRLREWFPIQ